MSSSQQTAPRGRGRPRSEHSRRAILRAAAELLREQGLHSMTIEGIAERARVAKKTIYHWWPSKAILALDAFYEQWSTMQEMTPDTGTLPGDLRLRARATAGLMSSASFGPTLAAFAAEAQTDPKLAQQFHGHVLEPLRAQARPIFTRAISRREIPPGTDIDAAIDLFQGPLFLRLLYTHAPLTRQYADTIVNLATTGLLRRDPAT